MRRTILLAVCMSGLLLLGGAALAAESGSVRKTSELKQAPFRDAKTIVTLATGEKLSILKAKGGWYQVKSGQHSGWIRMLSVQRGQARKGGTTTEFTALTSGRAGTGHVVSTTGIRGLSEEELKLSRYDAGEVKKLEGYAVSQGDAQAYARKGGLKVRAVD